MDLKFNLEEIEKDFEGTLGITAKNLGTGEEAIVNGDIIFPLASVFKIPVIVTLYRQVDAGNISLDDKIEMTDYARVPGSGVLKELSPGHEMTIRDYRTLMMLISDNTATDMVVDLLGKENINNTMIELGLKDTRITTCREILFSFLGLVDVEPNEWTIELWNETIKKMRDECYKPPEKPRRKTDNVTTPNEMMKLLEKIYKGEAASKGSCDEIIELMKKCQTGKNRISKYLPRDEVKIAHKTGTIKGVANDVGIVFPKEKEPYIICVFTKDIEGEPEIYVPIGEKAIATASKIIYDCFVT